MVPSGVDAISPAFQHAKQQLFRPFRFGQWTRLALVGLFAGEMSSGGGCNFNYPTNTTTTHRQLLDAAFPNPAIIGAAVVILLVAAPVLWLIFAYVNSRMRFILFESVIARRCEIRRMWQARREPAWQYFLFQIVFGLVMLAGIAVLVGIPALAGFLLGWFTAPKDHLAPLILGGIFVFFLFMAWLLLSIVTHVFTKDFVVPQMALENISAFDGWRRLLKMVQSEKGGYAGYAGMKLVLNIGAGIGVGILSVILIIILLIPFGGLGAIAVLAGRAAGMGLTWNVFTITLAIVVGSVFLLTLFYCIALISVPVIVFFPAYSIYFFAARYPLLGNLIYPPPPQPPPLPPAPPIMPAPEPVA